MKCISKDAIAASIQKMYVEAIINLADLKKKK
jgi:hypothetical protein